jgi:FtsP/CotA-like multicopper oxidase with cupredoxin domain
MCGARRPAESPSTTSSVSLSRTGNRTNTRQTATNDQSAQDSRSQDGPEIPEPASIYSHDGVVRLTLTAAPARVTVAGRTFVTNVYNGSYIPPVLRVTRGDEVRIKYVNDIDNADIEIDRPERSNVHFHGMGISPKEPADNPYISIPSSRGDDTDVTEAARRGDPHRAIHGPQHRGHVSVSRHIAEHADNGMMANMLVRAPANAPAH